MASSKAESRVNILRESKIVQSCELREELQRDEHTYFEIVSYLIDGSRLYVSERWEGDARLFYAYYWVKDNKVMAGWNNAPTTGTFPHFHTTLTSRAK